MKTLIFEASVSGHHLEYLHHYYMGALSHKEEKYIIMVPKEFLKVQDKYEWPKANNITFEYLRPEDELLLKEHNFYKLGWNVSKILNKAVRSRGFDKVLLTMLMQFIPFIIFLLPRKVLVRGIMYKIYLYEEKNMSWFRLMAEKIRFWLAARSSIIEKIFVLNDALSAQRFNCIYNTNKFLFLPDPVPKVILSQVHDMRKELNISPHDRIYLHFGSLNYRKGTIDILNAIASATRQEMENRTFIFAGKIKQNMRNDFYSLLDEAKKKAKILVFDRFCSYEFLYNLCFTCDVVLMPYYLTNLSSGLLGYTAVFQKPVIGPDEGLIGHLIKHFKMGYAIQVPISKRELLKNEIDYDEKGLMQYVKNNSINTFSSLIME